MISRRKREREFKRLPGIMTEVIKGVLYLSDERAACDDDLLKKYEIKVVVTCRNKYGDDRMPKVCENLGIRHTIYPIPDSPRFKINKYFRRFNTLVTECEARNEPVLVHCWVGMSRSATLVLSNLILRFEKPLVECYSFLKQKRNIIRPNSGFLSQLRSISSTSTTPIQMNNFNKEKNPNPNSVVIVQIPKDVLLDARKCLESGKPLEDVESLYNIILANGIYYGFEDGRVIILTTNHIFEKEDDSTSVDSDLSSLLHLHPIKPFREPEDSTFPDLLQTRREIYELALKLHPDGVNESDKDSPSRNPSRPPSEKYELSFEDNPFKFPNDEAMAYIGFIFIDKIPDDAPFPTREEIIHTICSSIDDDTSTPTKLSEEMTYLPNILICRRDNLRIIAVKPSTILHYSDTLCDSIFLSFEVSNPSFRRFLSAIPKTRFVDPCNEEFEDQEEGKVLGYIMGGTHKETIVSLTKSSSFSKSPQYHEIFEKFMWSRINLSLYQSELAINKSILSDLEEGAQKMHTYLLHHFSKVLELDFLYTAEEKEVMKELVGKMKEYTKSLVLPPLKKFEQYLNELLQEVIRRIESRKEESEGEDSNTKKIISLIVDFYCRFCREEREFNKGMVQTLIKALNYLAKKNQEEKDEENLCMDHLAIYIPSPEEQLLNLENTKYFLLSAVTSLFGGEVKREGRIGRKRRRDSLVRGSFLTAFKFLVEFFYEDQEVEEQTSDQDLEEEEEEQTSDQDNVEEEEEEEGEEDQELATDFKSLLCTEARKGKLKPPLLPISIFLNETDRTEPFVREESRACCGFSGSLVTLNRHDEEEEVVLCGMICTYDVKRMERMIDQSIVYFGSSKFREFWKKARSLDPKKIGLPDVVEKTVLKSPIRNVKKEHNEEETCCDLL